MSDMFLVGAVGFLGLAVWLLRDEVRELQKEFSRLLRRLDNLEGE